MQGQWYLMLFIIEFDTRQRSQGNRGERTPPPHLPDLPGPSRRPFPRPPPACRWRRASSVAFFQEKSRGAPPVCWGLRGGHVVVVGRAEAERTGPWLSPCNLWQSSQPPNEFVTAFWVEVSGREAFIQTPACRMEQPAGPGAEGSEGPQP